MRNNKGITLVELVVVIGLIFLVLPFAWDYMISSVEDSATITNKVAVQNSVQALMNQLQKDIQEGRYPINPTDKYDEIDSENGFLICKPGDTSVIYKFDLTKKQVTLKDNLRLEREDLTIKAVNETPETNVGVYDYIKEITLEKVSDSDGVNNGIKVYIRGEADEKSGFTLTNTYYTRNTIF